jgi:hypothetical protein
MSIPPGSLQAQYDLSDPASYPGTGNTIFDLSGNARNATKTGTVGFVSDGQASYLDLTGAGYFTSSSFLIPSVQNWTFTGWFYCDEPLASTGYYFLSSVTSITNDPTYGGSPFIAFGWAVPSVWAGSATYNRGSVWAPVQANLTDWYYITYTSNGTNTELYINGVSVGTQNQDTRILGTNMNLRLGSSLDTFDEAVGKLAYAEMYSDCLAAGDVLALYNATASRFAPPIVPIAEYSPFDNASYPGTGNTWFDLSANNNDLALSNQTFATTPVKSFTFANGYASNPTPTNLPTNIFTIDAWIKFNSTSQQILYGVGKDVGGGGQEALLIYKWPGVNGGKPYVEMGSGVGLVYFNLDPVIGQWYNITWSADGTTTTLYVDGVLDNSGAQGGQIGATFSGIVLGQLVDGTGGPSGLFYSDASFGQFNIYNQALDAGTILQNYNDNVINYPAPIAQYDFQNGSYPGSGTTVFDLSGTGNTLAITSGGTWVSGTPNYFDLAGNTAIYKSPALGGIASTNIFTINGWYYLPTTVLNSVVLDVGKDIANQSAQIASGFSLGELFVSGGFGYGVLEYTGASQPGWNFVSYVSTGSSTIAYLNGASVGSTTNVPSLPSDAGIIIGTALNNASPPVPRLDLAAVGRVGYFDVYNVALGPGDISTIYNATSGSYAPSPPSSNGVGGRQFAQGFNG